MKKTLTAISFALLMSIPTHAGDKFACIDTNKILNESKLVKSAQEELRNKLVEFQKEMSKKQGKLQELKKKIESKAVSQKVKEEKIKEYQKIESEARQLQEKAQRELESMKQRLEQMVFNKVKESAEKLAKEKSLTGIMDCAVFIYKDSRMDITGEIIKLIDTKAEKK